MKALRFPTTKEESDYMRMRRDQNLKRAAWLKAENEFMQKFLIPTGIKFSRQAQWGYRLFDFWVHDKGVAIEIDGPEHNRGYDAHRDLYNFLRSGIIVLRVRNFHVEDSVAAAKNLVAECSWHDRRACLGLLTTQSHTKQGRRELARNGDKNEALRRIDEAGLFCTYGKPIGPSIQARLL